MEELIEDFEKILTMTSPSSAMASSSQASNQSFNVSDLITLIVNNELNPLKDEIVRLKSQLNHKINKVEDYQVESHDPTIKCETSYEIIKSVREFKGEEDKYVSWRESAEIAMGQYTRGSERFFSALSILRNKITGTANDALTHNGTVLNFDAIMARLDFVFSDKRPIHLIEQDLGVLSQGKLSIMEYYGLVNKKLTLLINKTIMTYGRNKPITSEMNEKHRKTALRVFITGLNGHISDVIFSMNPPDLPNAMVIVQELESNNLRAQFANNYSTSHRRSYESNSYGHQNSNNKPRQNNNNNFNTNHRNTNNLRFNQSDNHNRNNYYQNRNQNWNQGRQYTSQNNNQNQWNSYKPQQSKPEPMEVDESLQVQNRPKYQNYNNYNNNNYYQNKKAQAQTTQQNQPQNKREPTGTINQPANKTMRLNNIEEDHFLGQNPE